MTTKQYLMEIDRLNKLIQNKLSEIYQLKIMAGSVSAVANTERVQTSGDKDRLGATVAKIVDLERETDGMVDAFIDKRMRIIRQIEGMEKPLYYHILFQRYVDMKTFPEIAESNGYTTRHIQKLHDEAILAFEEQYHIESRH